jgi:hypothetical protein
MPSIESNPKAVTERSRRRDATREAKPLTESFAGVKSAEVRS